MTVVTQNIDGLHYSAGSRDIIELHGQSLTATLCLHHNSIIIGLYVTDAVIYTIIAPENLLPLPHRVTVSHSLHQVQSGEGESREPHMSSTEKQRVNSYTFTNHSYDVHNIIYSTSWLTEHLIQKHRMPGFLYLSFPGM